MKLRLIATFIITILVLTACNGGDKETSEPTTDPNELVTQAAAALDNISSFELSLEPSGNEILLDVSKVLDDTFLSAKRAEGVFVAPDKMQADVQVSLDAISMEVELLAIGDDQFIRHQFLTQGQWRQETLVRNFNPSALISGELSLPNALRALTELEYLGEEELDGVSMYHIRGNVEAALIKSLTFGLTQTDEGQIQADLFIRKNNHQLEQLQLIEPLKEGQSEPTTWKIGLYNYNTDVTIERPEIE